MRLDVYLSKKYENLSRNKAQELIIKQKILVNDKLIIKTSFEVEENDVIKILEDKIYVSRAAEKLFWFLKENNIKVEDKICLDIGSSTGGFIQVLLDFGAAYVYGVDVGTNQLHPSLKNIKNLKVFEQTDIRNFQSNEKFDLITCDVSFIGIVNILDKINSLANLDIIILFKPQFEVGKNIKRNTKGVIKDEKAIKNSQKHFLTKAYEIGWELICEENSKIKGKAGNAEIFYYFKKK